MVCRNPQPDDACGTCPACKKMDKLIHPDIHFVFPVINKKGKESISDSFIDEWRDFVKESPYSSYSQWIKYIATENKQGGIFKDESDQISRKVNLKSYEAECKIVIIWSADKMNESASNKLLKILEEPPEKTHFFLLSAHPEKMLQTILSRTQIINVPPITIEEIERFLIQNKSIPSENAHDLALFSEGNLESAIDFIERREEFEQNTRDFYAFIQNAKQQKYADLLAFIDGDLAKNRNRQIEFLQYSLHIIRQRFLSGQNNSSSPTNSSFDINQTISFSQAQQLYQLFQKAIVHIERNVNSRIVLLDTAIQLRKIL